MKKLVPTLITMFGCFSAIFILLSTNTIQKMDYVYLIGCSVFFALLNVVFILLLQRSKGAKSISALIGVSGLTMVSFVALLLSYGWLTKEKLTMMIAVFLFVMYILYKVALFLPFLGKQE